MTAATTTRTPADELRDAVTKLRETAAQCADETDWYSAADFAQSLCGEDAPWAALMSPALAEPLAVLLESIGGDMAEQGAVEGSASRKVHPASPLGIGLMEPRADWTAALAAARAINGTV